MRLIDIDDISLRKTIACGGLSAKALWRRIQQQPTIDAVSVVRCKECKHCKKKKGTFRGEPIFFYRCEEHNRDVESDDYCSWGERSDNGKDIQSATE